MECAAVDTKIRAFLDQNSEHFASLQKLAEAPRKKEMQSFRKAFDKAEAVTAKCENGRAREIDAKLNTVGSDPVQIAGFYPRVTATIEFILQTNLHGLVELTQKVGAKMIARSQWAGR